MPTALVSVETAHREQVEPNVQADPHEWRGQGCRLLRRVTNLLRRRPKTGASYSDSLFGRPERVENDYYRFRHQPRG